MANNLFGDARNEKNHQHGGLQLPDANEAENSPHPGHEADFFTRTESIERAKSSALDRDEVTGGGATLQAFLEFSSPAV